MRAGSVASRACRARPAPHRPRRSGDYAVHDGDLPMCLIIPGCSVVSFGCSKNVGRPYADVVDALRTRGLEKARRREMHVDGIDIDMGGGLPFGVEVVLFAEKAV